MNAVGLTERDTSNWIRNLSFFSAAQMVAPKFAADQTDASSAVIVLRHDPHILVVVMPLSPVKSNPTCSAHRHLVAFPEFHIMIIWDHN